jgi:hypothetical protein
MNLIFQRMKKVFPKLNREPVTEIDFWRVARRENIFVHFWKLAGGVNGFYGVNRRYKIARHYIVLNASLIHKNWLRTGLHELNHHFLHAPATNLDVYFSSNHRSDRQDKEAEDLALIQLIPRPIFFKMSRVPFDEIEPETVEMLIQRKELFERTGF